MEFVRTSRNVWGQEVLQGMSWDLIGLFFATGLAVIVVHALYRLFLARPNRS
jgi:hypothetical protein